MRARFLAAVHRHRGRSCRRHLPHDGRTQWRRLLLDLAPVGIELVREADGEWRIEKRSNWLLDGNPAAPEMLADLHKVRR